MSLPNEPLTDHSEPLPGDGILSLTGAALLALIQPVLEKGLPVRFEARGFSMSPFIRDGDVITLQPYGTRAPMLGDVVAYLQPGSERLIVHRLVRRTADGWLIQGDASPGCPDGPLEEDRLLARVSLVERQGRRVRLGLGTERSIVARLSHTGRLTAWVGSLAAVKRFFKGSP